MVYRAVVSFFVLLACGRAWPYEPGTTGMNFLKLGIGARPVAMGNAYSAVSDDGNALFWNPAGLGVSRGVHLSAMGMNLLGFVNYFSLGSLVPLGRYGGLGAGVSYLFAEDTRYDELGQEQGTFTNSDLLIALGYAYPFIPELSGGASMKFIRSTLAEYDALSLGADVGVIWKPIDYIYLGSSLRNLGTPRKFIDELEYPPTNLRNGVAFKFPIGSSQFTLASDVSLYPDADPTFSAGAELALRLGKIMKAVSGQSLSGISLRGGYESGYHLGTWGGLTFGLGIEYEAMENFFLCIDGVYFSYGYLGESERVSLSLRYEPNSEPEPRSRRRPARSRR